MRFPHRFELEVREGVLVTACERPPLEALGVAEAEAMLRLPHVFTTRQFNTLSWPVQRVVVAWTFEGTELAPATLSMDSFVFDHAAMRWFAMRGTEAEQQRLAALDVPCLLDVPKAGTRTGPDPIEIMLVPDLVGRPSGRYTFVMGADVSSGV